MGKEGKSPPIPKYHCLTNLREYWDEAGFDYTYDWKWLGTSVLSYYTVPGKSGTKAGDGGDGGRQGNPGLAGKFMLFEVDRAPKLEIQKNIGNNR